jgi:hypothetical protein
MLQQVSDSSILQTFQNLPLQYKEEALNFMQFLVYKYEQEKIAGNETNDKKKRQIGYFPKGSFVLSDDFDAPLDCFKDNIQ